jgi:glutaredoxin
MFKNVTKEIKSLFKTFNKLKLPVKLLILAAVVFVVYKYVHKSRILGFSFQNSLHVTEGFGSKTLTYYRMEGCPHCKRFDEDGWPKFKELNNTSIEPRIVDSSDSECKKNGVQGFPTILLTDNNKNKISECSTRDPEEMIKFCKDNE